jgi:hypothetical protein
MTENDRELRDYVEKFAKYYKECKALFQKTQPRQKIEGQMGGRTCGHMTKKGKPCRNGANCAIHRF